MKLWIRRTFWDGSEAIFLVNRGSMSCYDLDSPELGDIITRKKNELNDQMNEWRDLQELREEHVSGKASD